MVPTHVCRDLGLDCTIHYMPPIISVAHLSKTFSVYEKKPGLKASLISLVHRPQKLVNAVEDISFTIAKGELVGFIGPNGAGKTTTLKMLSGLLFPTGGHLSVLGYLPQKRQPTFLRQIGFVMGQKGSLWWELPPQETYELHRAVYQIPKSDFTQRLAYLTESLDVVKEITIPTRKLSLGQRMKCELIASLLHNPQVLFLDEPTIGLDVVMQEKIRDFIKDYNRRYHATIILTSHYMKDVEALCKRVIVIDRGRLCFDGLLAHLSTQYSKEKILKFTFTSPVATKKLSLYGTVHRQSPLEYHLHVPHPNTAQVASKILASFPVADLTIEDPPIESVIRHYFVANASV